MTAEERQRESTRKEFERALVQRDTARYGLTLFVNGASVLSARAVAAIREVCEANLPDRYDLVIVDIHTNPDLVRSHGVVAAPTLIKDRPLPRRVLVGDLSDNSRLLIALGIGEQL